MIFKNSQFTILNKERKDIKYGRDVYRKRIQSEANSFLDQEDQPDTIVSQDILYVDQISN